MDIADLYLLRELKEAVASSYGLPLGAAMLLIAVKLLAGSSGKSDGFRSLPFIEVKYNNTERKSLK